MDNVIINASHALKRDYDRYAEVRDIVRVYYQIQRWRVAANNRWKAYLKSDKPYMMAIEFANKLDSLEAWIENKLREAIDDDLLAAWMLSLHGVGTILAAGFVSSIDWAVDTPAKVWRYAGLDPTIPPPQRGQPRVHNAFVKALCWKFADVQNKHKTKSYYGQIIDQRKRYEWERNTQGMYAAQARERAAKVGTNTDAYKWYSGCYSDVDLSSSPPRGIKHQGREGVPMLPPSHIHMRAMRYAAKLFLSHAWYVAQLLDGKQPRLPYAIDRLGHKTFIPPPNLDVIGLGT